MQMIDFKTIRAAVPTIQAAKDYGLDVGRHGMARCPFHDDHSPSLKLDDRFYCFGCGTSGDVIDFTARYFGISLQSAAEKLCRDYGLIPSRFNPVPISANSGRTSCCASISWVLTGSCWRIGKNGTHPNRIPTSGICASVKH